VNLDSHQHFWKYDATEYPWMQPDWPIRRDFLPIDLAPLLAGAGLDGCIAVQARQTLEESRWLLELADRHPIVQGVVGWVDLQNERVEEQLAQFAANSKFVGVRHVVQDEPDDNFMLRPAFQHGLAQLQQFNLAYDILVYPRQLAAAIKVVQNFPEQRFVLDHLAKPAIREGTLSPWREQVRELAKLPNVSCKVSGMVTEARWDGWQAADFRPYLDVVFAAFGVDRLMYGSDWPVCLLSGSYEQVAGLVREYAGQLALSDQAKFWGENAARFYRVNASAAAR
jgi:L-fuconolactonase